MNQTNALKNFEPLVVDQQLPKYQAQTVDSATNTVELSHNLHAGRHSLEIGTQTIMVSDSREPIGRIDETELDDRETPFDADSSRGVHVSSMRSRPV